jgi:hypothetical protein
MISGELMGRLGNQMFIIAAAHSLAYDNKDSVVFPDSLTGITPTIKEAQLHKNTILRKLKYTNDLSFVKYVHVEPSNHSYLQIEYKEDMFLKGYFQSEKYFNHNRQKILELFSPQKQIDNFLNNKYADIINSDNSVSVHVRRGDYLKLSEFHAVLGKEYYDKAMSKYHGARFVFFSDDIEWCRSTFNSDDCFFVDKQDDVLDLYLMSKITNNVIANSSFSWWGAWMNENKNKTVVCPSRWFGPQNSHLIRKDLTPTSWNVIILE